MTDQLGQMVVQWEQQEDQLAQLVALARLSATKPLAPKVIDV